MNNQSPDKLLDGQSGRVFIDYYHIHKIKTKECLKDEANEILNAAMTRWANKPEQQQLTLVDANLRLQRRDVDGALSILSKVTPNQPIYSAARIQMAQIYLREKRDKQQFTACYRFQEIFFHLQVSL